MAHPEDQQPLLNGLHSNTSISELKSEAIEEFLEHKPVAVRWWIRLVGWESRLLWILSGASIIVSVFNYMLTFATLSFTGHLGALELAGASVASVGIQGLAYGIMVRLLFILFFYLRIYMLLVFQGNRALGKLLFHIYSFQDCRAHHTNIVDNECLQCLCSVKRGA